MLDSELVEHFIVNFVGYGNVAAPYWFIGMEEGGDSSDESLAHRLSLWRDRGNPHRRLHMEPRVRPGEHPRGLVLVEEVQPHEQPEHGAAERLGQPRGVVRGPRKRPIGPEPAVRDEQMQVRIPVGARAVRLQAGDDADREVLLTHQRADRGGDGARGDARDVAE